MSYFSAGIWAALICSLVGLTTIGAQDAKTDQQTKMGTVVSADTDTLEVRTFGGNIAVRLAPGGTAWKKSIRSDFSAIMPGDRLLMRGRQGPSGTFVASKVWANIVSFHGRIINVKGEQYEVRADHSGMVRAVRVGPSTLGLSAAPVAPGELDVGRGVQVIGLELPDGSVEATRVIPDMSINEIPPGEGVITPGNRPNPR